MNICVYGASSSAIDKKYLDQTESLSYQLAERGCSLVFGGGNSGNMGAAARGFKKGGGMIVGVAPRFFNVDGMLYEECDELIRTDTMRERKQIMEDRSDAFVTTPGGIGTYEEFFEILTLKQLGRHNKPIVLYNIGGYYDNMIKLLEQTVRERFMLSPALTLYLASDKQEEIIDYILNYKEKMRGIEQFKLF